MPENSKKTQMVSRKNSIFWSIGSLLLGAGIMFFLNYFTNGLPSITPTEDIRINDASYTYINPLLECNVGSSISDELQSFKGDLQEEINKLTKQGEIDSAAVYFRDMNNGPWFGINETEEFFPASLLKVPVAMAYLKQSESNPALPAEKIVFATSTNQNVEYFASTPLKLGATYTVNDLIKAMVVNSDNDALDLLLTHADANNVDPQDTFKYLNVSLAQSGMVTVRQYATFFRILFNSSYLSYDDSEKLLSMLAQSTFTEGLRAGVPANIPVAHKFGEQWTYTGTERELHDCGIVYYPGHPYLLCVMTEGSDFDAMASAISDISFFVYKQVDSQLKNL